MSAATPHPARSGIRLTSLLACALAGCMTPAPDLPPVPIAPGGIAKEWRTSEQPTREGQRAEPPPPPPAFAPAAVVRTHAADDVARVQVMLDRANFSPGCIDGRFGPQTRAALRAWQLREGLAATGELDEALLARALPLDECFATHVVSDAEHAALRPFPRDWRERAALDHHGYTTILEAVAERYHATERYLRELNPEAAWPNPAAGAVLRVPRVEPASRARAARIEIHLAGKYLQVFDEKGRLVGHFPCSIAKDVEKRPVGELKIVNAAEHPNYTFDPALFADDPAASGIDRRLIIPPGPNNPVGVAWMSLDRPGYGIHGTPFPEEIGKTESHGCFRLANWNARKVLSMISMGLPVHVYE